MGYYMATYFWDYRKLWWQHTNRAEYWEYTTSYLLGHFLKQHAQYKLFTVFSTHSESSHKLAVADQHFSDRITGLIPNLPLYISLRR